MSDDTDTGIRLSPNSRWRDSGGDSHLLEGELDLQFNTSISPGGHSHLLKGELDVEFNISISAGRDQPSHGRET